MADHSKELLTSPPVADDTFEAAATRLHALLDNYLANITCAEGSRPWISPDGAAARKIDANEFGVRESARRNLPEVEALVVNPTRR